MMTLSDAVSAFTTNKVPVAHVRFHGHQQPPYAEAHLNEIQNHYSDDRISRTLCEYEFVMHVLDRDLELEAAIEDALDASDITIEYKSTGHRADEDLVTVTYRFEVYERDTTKEANNG